MDQLTCITTFWVYKKWKVGGLLCLIVCIYLQICEWEVCLLLCFKNGVLTQQNMQSVHWILSEWLYGVYGMNKLYTCLISGAYIYSYIYIYVYKTRNVHVCCCFGIYLLLFICFSIYLFLNIIFFMICLLNFLPRKAVIHVNLCIQVASI